MYFRCLFILEISYFYNNGYFCKSRSRSFTSSPCKVLTFQYYFSLPLYTFVYSIFLVRFSRLYKACFLVSCTSSLSVPFLLSKECQLYVVTSRTFLGESLRYFRHETRGSSCFLLLSWTIDGNPSGHIPCQSKRCKSLNKT